MNESAVQYADLRDALASSSFGFQASEVHGNLCGIICSGGESAARRWIDECVSEHESDDPQTSARVRDALRAVVATTSPQLAGGEFAFQPLLPDDDAALDEQVDALAAYCHGFLEGLVIGSAAATRAPGPALREILGDFAEISRAGVTEGEDRDEADFALAELIEYVRAGVQLAFEELRERRAGAAPAH